MAGDGGQPAASTWCRLSRKKRDILVFFNQEIRAVKKTRMSPFFVT
jgi:regulation of enolase protein 1 (concanavalin A-like superfamily)